MGIEEEFAEVLKVSRSISSALHGSKFRALSGEYPHIPGRKHIYAAVDVRCAHAEGRLILSTRTWRIGSATQLKAICQECSKPRPGNEGKRRLRCPPQSLEAAIFRWAGEAREALSGWAIGPRVMGFFGA
jgi:hypothetical protein